MSRSLRPMILASALTLAAAVAAEAAPAKAPAQPPAASPAKPPAGGTELFPASPVIYDMETLRTGPLSADFVKQLEPLHTLQAVEDLLKANRITFAWGRGQVSSGQLPADFVKAINALPPHEVFVTPQANNSWLIGVVIEKH